MKYMKIILLFSVVVISWLTYYYFNTDRSYISVASAEKLLQASIKMKPSRPLPDPKLKDITTNEIRDRLNVRIFRLKKFTGNSTEPDSYLYKDGKMYPMSKGFGGWGLMQMCVYDIDDDSSDDLVYLYSFGSGLHMSFIEAFKFNKSYPTKILPNFKVVNADVSLKKLDNRIELYGKGGMGPKNPKFRLGELVFLHLPGRDVLSIKQDPDLPKKWKDNIWSIEPR